MKKQVAALALAVVGFTSSPVRADVIRRVLTCSITPDSAPSASLTLEVESVFRSRVGHSGSYGQAFITEVGRDGSTKVVGSYLLRRPPQTWETIFRARRAGRLFLDTTIEEVRARLNDGQLIVGHADCSSP